MEPVLSKNIRRQHRASHSVKCERHGKGVTRSIGTSNKNSKRNRASQVADIRDSGRRIDANVGKDTIDVVRGHTDI